MQQKKDNLTLVCVDDDITSNREDCLFTAINYNIKRILQYYAFILSILI